MTSNPRKASPAGRYNRLARVLHWLMAVMLLAMLFIGAAMMSSFAHRPWLLDLHRPLGMMILLLALVRLGNRLLHRAPALPASLPRWQIIAAKASHALLYALMLALPLLGWALVSAGGYPVTMLKGWVLPAIVPASPAWYAWLRDAHQVLAWLLFMLVSGHLAAALMHAWVYRDGVFAQMAKGRR